MQVCIQDDLLAIAASSVNRYRQTRHINYDQLLQNMEAFPEQPGGAISNLQFSPP